jgi:hypothetical protein
MELEECCREAAFQGGIVPKAPPDRRTEPRGLESEDTVVDDPNEHPRTRVDSPDRYAVTLVDARFQEPGPRFESGSPIPTARRRRDAMSAAFLLRVMVVMLVSAAVALGLVWLLLGPT